MPSFYDDFATAVNGQDITAYSANYTYVTGSGITFDTTYTPSGFAQPNFTQGKAYRNDFADQSDLVVEAGVAIVNRRASQVGFVARYHLTNHTYYQLSLEAATFSPWDRTLKLYRVNAGSAELGSYTVWGNVSPAEPVWVNLRLVLNGAQLDAYVQGPGHYPDTPPSGSWIHAISVLTSGPDFLNYAGRVALYNGRSLAPEGDGNSYNLYFSADTTLPSDSTTVPWISKAPLHSRHTPAELDTRFYTRKLLHPSQLHRAIGIPKLVARSLDDPIQVTAERKTI